MLAMMLAIAAGAVTPQMNWTAFDEADTKLTAAYDALAAHLDGASKIQLRDTERAWIARRNQDCGFEAKNDCASRRTLQRTAELEASIGQVQTYRTMADPRLLKLEAKLDDACRAPGQDANGPICARRDDVVQLLEQRGWCYGPDGAIEADEHWMRTSASCHNA